MFRKTIVLATALSGAMMHMPVSMAADELQDATLYIGWRAEAEFGGFFQALATGLYEEHGLNVEIQLGNPQSNPAQQLIAGKVDFAVGSSGTALNAAREEAPITAVAAMFQKDPRIMVGHPNQGYQSLEDMVGRTAYVGALGMATFWPYLRQEFGFSDEDVKPYAFSIAPFVADESAIQQGYATNEPHAVRMAGIEDPVSFLLHDYGYRPYAVNIMARQDDIANRPDFVQAFVNASIEGWQEYLHGDASSGNALIKERNPDMEDEVLDFALETIREGGFVDAEDAAELGIGAMTDERWREYYDTMVSVGVLPDDVDLSRAYTLQFVNNGVGLQ
jgi:NitT/TauT family transport system substrate-binding protein|tara:strand:+ start:143544 stop:144542 length:999 start_codon:yes stop_codon:yes gene_type:complete